jgi:hypothetical protein
VRALLAAAARNASAVQWEHYAVTGRCEADAKLTLLGFIPVSRTVVVESRWPLSEPGGGGSSDDAAGETDEPTQLSALVIHAWTRAELRGRVAVRGGVWAAAARALSRRASPQPFARRLAVHLPAVSMPLATDATGDGVRSAFLEGGLAEPTCVELELSPLGGARVAVLSPDVANPEAAVRGGGGGGGGCACGAADASGAAQLRVRGVGAA